MRFPSLSPGLSPRERFRIWKRTTARSDFEPSMPWIHGASVNRPGRPVRGGRTGSAQGPVRKAPGRPGPGAEAFWRLSRLRPAGSGLLLLLVKLRFCEWTWHPRPRCWPSRRVPLAGRSRWVRSVSAGAPFRSLGRNEGLARPVGRWPRAGFHCGPGKAIHF